MINVTLFGDELEYEGSKNGVYYMQPGFSNGQRYWISPEGNAIWIRHTGNQWMIGDSEDLGTTSVDLYFPIKDSSEECPHDSLESNWKYGTGGNGFVEDVSNSVRIHCLKGKHNA